MGVLKNSLPNLLSDPSGSRRSSAKLAKKECNTMENEDEAGGGREPAKRSNPDRSNWKNPDALDPLSFPHLVRNGQRPLTIENLKHLLTEYGIRVRYDVIRKRLHVKSERFEQGLVDNADSAAVAQILSLAALNGLPRGDLELFLDTIANGEPYNAIEEWILSKPWDGKNRLPEIYATLELAEHGCRHLKEILVRKWLLSAVAAALVPGFRSRGVLTLQGPQGIGKTSWFRALVPPELQSWAIKIDHHMDAHDKDSILGAISCWICEIGELDSAMKRDVARIKGVLTRESDKVRRPYARTESEIPRRTVFGATVNHANFLSDDTGNSRFWVLPVINVDHGHTVDTQQLFAQLAEELHAGAEWWLDDHEEASLDYENRAHRTVSAVADLVLDALDLDRARDGNLPAMIPRQLLVVLGVERPTNTECKECAAVLRDYLGAPKRIQGRDKWRIPLKSQFRNQFNPAEFDEPE
ncbi:virulence-associated E family protein [Sphingomonas sp. NSE70-1]|uniref:Virulence-associated E family protein n=1 Tax=Sphingomonas caseinilyticus TaxID=2908205 RepID=A0ABT0RWK7_9SPHN|nr:virulence-associated E family protein [Sphingomonas caseinilyticus]MCL6699090.1 virulence-associated E family protein [Sphingomonas caseinilyticus]